ncbi:MULTISPECIES: double-strand break repair protein AddB [unclassified Paracoccus (in: a-proteobacteria)]|uniref:double-strand break repair protein AddB n=1 Tax=unclassified Paracoccus (in: a-proteobacteria) TaxID=2688777 RepID=UPI0021E15051|nr:MULTISPECIES: double-strand break repair protein AddB [unclassified Paracoccus (in: a-proteobacteria)]UXU75762.1 double-strand break repair protein AddB [Paracoccus sp. SMMA_5]UXU81671.1 double-strand break repair protein AddB [Paracoccus sp. SMMA_5_TC]
MTEIPTQGWQNGLFALPCGADFPGALAEGLIARMRGRPPQDMARVTIYANSGQSLLALREAFVWRGPMVLPQLRLIADLGGGPVTPPLARRLDLGRLIAAALRAQPDLAQGQSVPDLASSLAGLMAEMQLEGLGAEALDRIDAGDHAQHWGRALAFLRIAAGYYLTDPPQDRESCQRAAAERLAAAWARGCDLPPGPVLVAGSTGSHGATRDFMRAVARLPQGAVVLPGFDFDLPQTVWDGLDARAEDHPQARYAPLLAEFGPPRPWLDAPAPDPARNRLLSLALRPAPVTDQWIQDGPQLGPLVPATANLTLIEAEQPGLEAEAVALIIREAVQRGQPVTLIAADRMLTRRVESALDRWGIIADDSAGRPLPLTAPGLFLRHVADLFGADLLIDRLLVLLKHPVTATGLGPEARRQHNLHSRDLELQLRKHGPAFPDGAALRAWADRGDAARKPWALWLADLLDRMAPLAQDRGPRPLTERLRELLTLAEDLAAGPGGDAAQSELWARDAGGQARAVLDHLSAHAHLGHDLRPAEFGALLYDELQRQAVRQDVAAHPLVRFRGPREARTEAVGAAAGLVILSGLNEGGWPQTLPPDPWLSRPMRLAAGLTLPERRIGLAAHDFQQAAAAPQVVLTRARRDAEAETIPSRWLNRLVNLLAGLPDQQGPQALAAMRARGENWLALARAQARPRLRLAPAPRPSPIPPAPALSEMSVTEVRTLIRDPYAVYARRVLGLRPLDPLRPAPDAAERGTVLHDIMDRFLRGLPDHPETQQLMVARLLTIADEVLARDVPWPSARLFWRARIARVADRLMADEAARLTQGRPVLIEDDGRLSVPGAEFRLRARPDRLDLLADGRVQVYDYKSGKPPTDQQIAHFDKQLPLEAAMVELGGFSRLGPVEVAGISYIHLGGEGRTEPRSFAPGDGQRSWQGFVTLIGRYLRGERGFTARLAMERTDHASDYDHLSRHGEWDATQPARPERFRDG